MKATKITIYVIDFVFGLVLVALLFRFVLKLFAANPNTLFVQWVYETTLPLLAPFMGIFPSPRLEGGLIIEFTTLFAIIVYAIIQLALIKLVEAIADTANSKNGSAD